jgi:uncharacterized protein YbjT (DUF2867 family)
VILVTGATGNVGSELVAALLETGERVRALVRTPERPLPAGAEAVLGDLNEPAGLDGALRGCRGLFLLSGYRDMPGLVARARGVGVERVVLLSGGAAVASDVDNAISRYMLASERAVRDSGLAWTILRPYAFMSNTLRWIPQLRGGDVVRVPFTDVPVAVIDPYDIARVAANALVSPGHDGRVYRLSGPEALRPADQLRVLGDVLGRELQIEAQSAAQARAEMEAAMPAEYVRAFLSFYVEGTLDESPVLATVEQVTGVPPRRFAAWARAHQESFR